MATKPPSPDEIHGVPVEQVVDSDKILDGVRRAVFPVSSLPSAPPNPGLRLVRYAPLSQEKIDFILSNIPPNVGFPPGTGLYLPEIFESLVEPEFFRDLYFYDPKKGRRRCFLVRVTEIILDENDPAKSKIILCCGQHTFVRTYEHLLRRNNIPEGFDLVAFERSCFD